MDILAHALYGATVCSDTGLGGGRSGSTASRGFRDPTVWWAMAFGILPDVISMWVPFAAHVMAGPEGNFFHHFGGGWLIVYRMVHNLVTPLALSGVLFVCCRRLFKPSLAWGVHVVTDAVSHGAGKYQTLLFYPFTDWGIKGIAWWRTPWFVFCYWALLPATWLLILAWRRTQCPNGEIRPRGGA